MCDQGMRKWHCQTCMVCTTLSIVLHSKRFILSSISQRCGQHDAETEFATIGSMPQQLLLATIKHISHPDAYGWMTLISNGCMAKLLAMVFCIVWVLQMLFLSACSSLLAKDSHVPLMSIGWTCRFRTSSSHPALLSSAGFPTFPSTACSQPSPKGNAMLSAEQPSSYCPSLASNYPVAAAESTALNSALSESLIRL